MFWPFWKVSSAPAGFSGWACTWPLYQASCCGQGLSAAPPGYCYSPNIPCVMSSQEGASLRGGVGDNTPGCVPVDTRGCNGISQEVVFPCMFPREHQIFAKSISRRRETLTT